jgi:hypothetical protein
MGLGFEGYGPGKILKEIEIEKNMRWAFTFGPRKIK